MIKLAALGFLALTLGQCHWAETASCSDSAAQGLVTKLLSDKADGMIFLMSEKLKEDNPRLDQLNITYQVSHYENVRETKAYDQAIRKRWCIADGTASYSSGDANVDNEIMTSNPQMQLVMTLGQPFSFRQEYSIQTMDDGRIWVEIY
jgi:hypothetical protein